MVVRLSLVAMGAAIAHREAKDWRREGRKRRVKFEMEKGASMEIWMARRTWRRGVAKGEEAGREDTRDWREGTDFGY